MEEWKGGGGAWFGLEGFLVGWTDWSVRPLPVATQTPLSHICGFFFGGGGVPV